MPRANASLCVNNGWMTGAYEEDSLITFFKERIETLLVSAFLFVKILKIGKKQIYPFFWGF